MTVYTVSSTDDVMREPLSSLVIGSYTTRGKALDECVAYVMERLSVRQDLAWALLHDENHPEARRFFVEHKDGTVGIRRGCVSKWKAYLRDELGGQGCYYVYDGVDNVFHFDVDENDLCGDCWSLVTWGDSDCEDPEFTTPKPETFTSKETAVKTFVDYARVLFKAHGLRFIGVENAIRKSLDEDGRVQVDLSDGCCVSCVLYHDDAKNIKE